MLTTSNHFTNEEDDVVPVKHIIIRSFLITGGNVPEGIGMGLQDMDSPLLSHLIGVEDTGVHLQGVK